MTMVIKPSPATFKKLMNNVLSGIIGIKYLVCLDDRFECRKTLYNHNSKLVEVFKQLKIYNLKIQPNKYEFLKRERVYLGHAMRDQGTLPDSGKSTSRSRI